VLDDPVAGFVPDVHAEGDCSPAPTR
jgi:hypothetical protein